MKNQKQTHPPKLKVSVTTDHIVNAKQRDSHHCMIADAIKETVPNAKYILVDLQSIRYTDKKKGLRYTYLTPPLAQQALINFDQGKKVEPFSFSAGTQKGTVNKAKINRNKNAPSSKGRKHSNKRKTTNPIVSEEREFGVRKLSL